MGDGAWWRKATYADTISYAEPLSSFLYGTVHRLFGADAIEWISPAIGFVATYAWLLATDRISAGLPEGRLRLARATAATLWASSGLTVIFCSRFVEHTQLGVPLLLLGLSELVAWTRTERTQRLLSGGALVSVAALAHLQYTGMAVAAFGAAVIVATGRGRWAAARAAAVLAATFVAVLGLAAGAIAAGPFELVHGSVAGGVDGEWLAPSIFAADHVALVAEALTFAVPVALPLSVAAVWRVRDLHRAPARDLVLVAPALAYVVFVTNYGFDLGWPRDADLMVSMSVSLLLGAAALLLPALGSLPPLAALAASLIVVAGLVWSAGISAKLVRPAWINLSQRNSAAATLLVDGSNPTDSEAPHRVPVTAGVEVQLQLSGPPGYSYWILQGAPDPACEGDPYGSMVDIEIPEGIASAFVHFGVLDERGRAAVPFVVRPLADGTWPGLQMMTFPGTDHTRNTTSAAFYFEPK